VGSESRPVGTRRASSYQPPAPSTGPQRETEESSGAARRAALARPPAGCMGAARPPSSAVGPSAAAAGRSTGVPDRLFGRCERLLRRPPPRGHAPAAAARLASAAPSAPSRRAARAAASSRRWAGRGAGSARPSSGARRAQSVHQSTGRPQQAVARSSAASSPSWRTACERDEAVLVVAGAARRARGLCCTEIVGCVSSSLVPCDKRCGYCRSWRCANRDWGRGSALLLLLAAAREWLRLVAWLGATLVGVRGWGQSAHSSQLAVCSVLRTIPRLTRASASTAV